jgi:hypothetical protein
MAHVQANITKFYSRLQEYWRAEKYTDVTVECANGVSFKCHRVALAAASDYFAAMFGGDFVESTAENVTLTETDAATFEPVLRFMYSGDVVISSSNVYDLLQASEYFKLPGMEELCVQFVQKNKMTVQNTLDIFTFACSTNKNVLKNALSRYVASQFDIFSKVSAFLELPFDDLKLILDQLSSSPTSATAKNDESLLGALLRWIYHRREERAQYVHDVIKLICFENISSAYLRSVFTKVAANFDITTLTRITKPVGYDEVSELPKNPLAETEISGLHVFVKHKDVNLMRIYSVNGDGDCCVSNEIAQTHPQQWVRCVTRADNSYMYAFNYFRVDSKLRTVSDQTFSAYTSVSMRRELRLKSPPLIFEECDMCGLRNNIYVYNEWIFKEAVRTNSSHSSAAVFDDDEIGRGLYVYNCEVDDWFSVPKMKRQLEGSCMVACDDILYLIGGEASDGTVPGGYVQAYDHRAGKWRRLPETNHLYTGAACCAIDGKIYVSGGRVSSREVERYDPVAGKWETITSMNKKMVYHRMVNYSNRLWAMGSFDMEGHPANDLSIEMYNPKSMRWSSFVAVSLTAAGKTTSPGTIMEAIVFKY